MLLQVKSASDADHSLSQIQRLLGADMTRRRIGVPPIRTSECRSLRRVYLNQSDSRWWAGPSLLEHTIVAPFDL